MRESLTPANLDAAWQWMTPEERAELDALLADPVMERARFRDNPEAFVREILNVEEPAPYQIRILNAVVTHRRVCVRAMHGVGKTTVSAWLALWFVTTREHCKVPITASAWRQLREFLWPEIHRWALRGKWGRLGITLRPKKELLSHRIEITPTQTAFALNSVDEAKIEGAHADNILYIFDEAKTIPPAIWDAAEGALATRHAYALALSTPGESTGRFYDIQTRKRGYEDWHVMHVTLDEAIAAGRVTREWAESRARAWGPRSAIYLRRVCGEFADDEAETVIPLGAIDRAVERWYALKEREERLIAESGLSAQEAFLEVWGPLHTLGCDPARMGRDRTGYAYRHTAGIVRVERTERQETMATVGKLVADSRDTTASVHIDPIGIGAGVVDRLRELWRTKEWRGDDAVCPAKAINVGVRTRLTDTTGEFRFRHLRDWLWWNMRELLMSDSIVLPPDEELREDLVVARYVQVSDGTITVESKDDMRARLPEKRSTDTGDAVLLAYYPDVPAYKMLLAII